MYTTTTQRMLTTTAIRVFIVEYVQHSHVDLLATEIRCDAYCTRIYHGARIEASRQHSQHRPFKGACLCCGLTTVRSL